MARFMINVACGLLLANLCVSRPCEARGPSPARAAAAATDMFAAVKNGELQVRVIPKDATQVTVLFKNQTQQPLSLRLPEAFAGVPVLAQIGGGGVGGLGGGGG